MLLSAKSSNSVDFWIKEHTHLLFVCEFFVAFFLARRLETLTRRNFAVGF